MKNLVMVGLSVLFCAACGASDHKTSTTSVPVPADEADNAKLVAAIDTSPVFGSQAEPMCSSNSDCSYGTCSSGSCGNCSSQPGCKGDATSPEGSVKEQRTHRREH